MRSLAPFLCVFLACSSDSDPGSQPPGDGGPGADARPGGAPDAAGSNLGAMSWKDGGAQRVSQVVIATRRKETGIDFLELIGATSSGDGLAIAISDVTPGKTTPLSGRYTCGTTGNVYVIFTYNATGAASPMNCTIDLAQAGTAVAEHAVGTFSAVLSDGRSLTEGRFDTPVMNVPTR
jgi:hypothetical protein